MNELKRKLSLQDTTELNPGQRAGEGSAALFSPAYDGSNYNIDRIFIVNPITDEITSQLAFKLDSFDMATRAGQAGFKSTTGNVLTPYAGGLTVYNGATPEGLQIYFGLAINTVPVSNISLDGGALGTVDQAGNLVYSGLAFARWLVNKAVKVKGVKVHIDTVDSATTAVFPMFVNAQVIYGQIGKYQQKAYTARAIDTMNYSGFQNPVITGGPARITCGYYTPADFWLTACSTFMLDTTSDWVLANRNSYVIVEFEVEKVTHPAFTCNQST